MSEGRLGSWIDQADGLFVVLDLAGRVLHANDACLELLGWTRGDFHGQDWVEVAVPADARDRVRARFARILEGAPEPWDASTRPLLCQDGTRVAVSWSDTVLREGGQSRGLLSLGRRAPDQPGGGADVETLTRRVQELSERNAELQSFARKLSHNLKSPLQSLVGRLDLLLIRPDLGGISRRDAIQAMELAHALNQAILDQTASWDAPEGSG